MNSFIPWVGGKKALRETILAHFPLYYERYVEVFGGGGWVLFAKPPGNDFEVYNDFNALLTNLYLCVQNKPQELINELRWSINSRISFERLVSILKRRGKGTQVQKAAWFYQVIRESYAAGLTSFAAQPHDVWSEFPIIEQAHRRLAKVVIENQDFEHLIRHYDRENTFFYCDPPYHGTERYYKNVGEKGFTERDHYRLSKALLSSDGKFLLSYNDDDFVRNLYDKPNIRMMEVERINNIRQRVEAGCKFKELLIGNYDLTERERLMPKQITLFDCRSEMNDEECEI